MIKPDAAAEVEGEIVAAGDKKMHMVALLDAAGGVWLTFDPPWYQELGFLWWWLTPGERKWVLLTGDDGKRVRIRACRVAKKLVRIGKAA